MYLNTVTSSNIRATKVCILFQIFFVISTSTTNKNFDFWKVDFLLKLLQISHVYNYMIVHFVSLPVVGDREERTQRVKKNMADG